MKLVSYLDQDTEHLGFVLHEEVYPLHAVQPAIPDSMDDFLSDWENHLAMALEVEENLKVNPALQRAGLPLKSVKLLAPVPRPGSFRDGYAFRKHVEAARRNRGLAMIPEFDAYPVFYFGNPDSITGPGPVSCMPDHFDKLDFELEVAAVICKRGRNIPAGDADQYIGGLMILNDLSARKLQMDEMLLSLGPAKGKDFATVAGPWLVSLNELEPFECPPPKGHTGKAWDLNMMARVNGELLSIGRLADMDWTFAELIERASYGADLFPGDVIGSGTVGTGCLLELNGTMKLADPDHIEKWLQEDDDIELEIERLGVLRTRIEKADSGFSLFAQKKTSHAD